MKKDLLIEELTKLSIKENKVPMENYMKNQFSFLGVKKPAREKLVKVFLNEEKQNFVEIDWDFVFKLWSMPEREFQYVAIDYINYFKNYLNIKDLNNIKYLVTNKSWWDCVDSLAKTLGYLVFKNPKLKDEVLNWSLADNMWLRRISIIQQIGLKDKTDLIFLEKVIINNLNSKEFFINKAIGWALREYSKVDGNWVGNFLEEYKDRGLSNLSIREASKYI